MRDILKSLMRTLVLLVCSIIQIYEAVFMGIGKVFCWIGLRLKNASSWLMKKLVRGKYENEMKAIIE
jgi:hypothetical protein